MSNFIIQLYMVLIPCPDSIISPLRNLDLLDSSLNLNSNSNLSSVTVALSLLRRGQSLVVLGSAAV